MTAASPLTPPDPAEEARLDERARCSGIVRELARAAAVHAAVARHVLRIAAMTGDADELMRKGQRLKELVARAEAFAEAVRAIEEEPGT
jgi:methyl coenzyme M reductase beta subunit